LLGPQGVDDESYECVYECEDDKGHRGVRLSKNIVKVAGRAMEQNFTSLGPHVLPIRSGGPTAHGIARGIAHGTAAVRFFASLLKATSA
jgi:3-ketoacyl-CoA synthase